ncbi:MAG TPA: MoaD/ThiS family protein [bacterium]|nr:MoaD/ThiS family protein [bacterium]
MTMSHPQSRSDEPRPQPGLEGLSAELRARLGAETPLETPEQCRAALVRLGLCDGARPAVILELYGGLRLKAGCRSLPLHAATIGEALQVLRTACPKVQRLLPPPHELEGHYRFSLNGRAVTADPDHALQTGDRLIVFSASVGG